MMIILESPFLMLVGVAFTSFVTVVALCSFTEGMRRRH